MSTSAGVVFYVYLLCKRFICSVGILIPDQLWEGISVVNIVTLKSAPVSGSDVPYRVTF
jgi:hypothetical protein